MASLPEFGAEAALSGQLEAELSSFCDPGQRYAESK